MRGCWEGVLSASPLSLGSPWGGWIIPACPVGTVSPHCWGEVSGTGICLPLCVPFHPGSKGGHIGWREAGHPRDAPGMGRKVGEWGWKEAKA